MVCNGISGGGSPLTKPINIGGINFEEKDIKNVNTKLMGTYNGKPNYQYTVETNHGTYKFFTQLENAANDKKKPSVFFDGKNVNINGCELSNLKGTDGSDSYVLDEGSYLSKADLADGNQDTIVIQKGSHLGRIQNDATDCIFLSNLIMAGRSIIWESWLCVAFSG